MINPKIYTLIADWIDSRGIPNTTDRHRENIHNLIASIIGQVVVAAVEGDKTEEDIFQFIELSKNNTVEFTNLTGRPFEFDALLSKPLQDNYFYQKLRRDFLTLRLGGVQSGDGELALVLFAQDGMLIINNKKADVYAGGYRIQCKKIGSNNESPKTMVEYSESKDVDLMFVINPDPTKRKALIGSSKRGTTSRCWAYHTRDTHWSEVIKFTGKTRNTLNIIHPY